MQNSNNDRSSSHHLIIWKDYKGINQKIIPPKVEMENLDDNSNLVYIKFMKAYKSYDLIPTSAKLLILDTLLPVKKAFLALIWNNLRAAPLWDGNNKKFIGMLTITDFIKILQKYYKNGQEHIPELEKHIIATWKDEISIEKKPLITIDSDNNLFEAIIKLCNNKIHRLPVIDSESGNILYILTHKRILRFLFLYIYDLPRPSFMNKTLEQLNLGTYNNIITIKKKSKLITAINLFVKNPISALPVVDNDGRIIDLYAKFDVFNLAIDKSYTNLEITIEQSFKDKRERLESVISCLKSEKLENVMEKIVKAEVHRLVIVDDNMKVIGLLSLSDILKFIATPYSTVSPENLSKEE